MFIDVIRLVITAALWTWATWSDDAPAPIHAGLSFLLGSQAMAVIQEGLL